MAKVGKSGNAHYILGLLTICYLLSLFDRQLLVLILVPIQRDLNIDDTQFGILYGIGFTLFYSIVSLLAAGPVDRLNRTKLLATALLIWTMATIGCGVARNFEELLAARMLVGVGEAVLAPVAYSLIADLFSPSERAKAFSIYAAGLFGGVALSFLIGGGLVEWLDDFGIIHGPWGLWMRGWQAGFLLAGLPGIGVAILLLAAREPARIVPTSDAAPMLEWKPFLGNFLKHWRALLPLHIALALLIGQGYANIIWLPARFSRNFGWSASDIGLGFGLAALLCGFLGAQAGSYTVGKLLQRGHSDALLRACSFACIAGFIGVYIAGVVPSSSIGLIGVMLCIGTTAFVAGPGSTCVQLLTPSAAQGKGGAFYTFFTQMLGSGLVPLVIAILAQEIWGEPMAIGQATAVIGTGAYVVCGVVLWRIRKFFLLPVEDRQLGSLNKIG